MDVNWLTPKAQTRKSGGKGWGAFAVEPIAIGEVVVGFGGWVVPGDVLATLPIERQHRSLQVADDLYLLSNAEAERGDMVNHSCDPNCGVLGSMLLVSLREIEVGEELTFDYAMCDASDYDEFECLCDSPACRGLVTGNDWRDPILQERYRGYFSAYLAARIAASR